MSNLPPTFYYQCQPDKNPWVPIKRQMAYADALVHDGRVIGLEFYLSHNIPVLRLYTPSPQGRLQFLVPEDVFGRSFRLDAIEAQDHAIYRLHMSGAASGVGFSTLYLHNGESLVIQQL